MNPNPLVIYTERYDLGEGRSLYRAIFQSDGSAGIYGQGPDLDTAIGQLIRCHGQEKGLAVIVPGGDMTREEWEVLYGKPGAAVLRGVLHG